MLLQRLTVDTTLTQPFISFDASFSLASMHNTPLASRQVRIGGVYQEQENKIPMKARILVSSRNKSQAEIAFYLKLRNFAGYGK